MALKLYTGNGSLNAFGFQTNVRTKKRFVVYQIRDVGERLKNLAILTILDHIWNRIVENRRIGKNTWFYVDEIYLLFQNEYSATFLNTLFRRARKYGGIPTGITQNVTPLLEKVTAELVVPEGFGQNCYVILMDENGISYRISCSEDNGYLSSIYLAEGIYFVDYAGVYGDNISQYSFDYEPEQIIEAKSGEPNVLHYKLNDFENIQQQINENKDRLEELTGSSKSETEEQVEETNIYYPAGIEGILVEAGGTTFYEVMHTGTTRTECIVTGNAIADADVVLKVIKEGVIGEAVVALSKDGGATYDTSAVISDTLYIGTLGVNVSFLMENDAEKFVIDDTFAFTVRENFRVIYNNSLSNGYITIFGHPMENQKLLIRMLSSGGRGESRFTVSYDAGSTIALQDIVPEDGKYALEDNLTLIFSDHAFAKGMEYTADIKSNDTTINYIPMMILCILLALLIVAAYESYKYISEWNIGYDEDSCYSSWSCCGCIFVKQSVSP